MALIDFSKLDDKKEEQPLASSAGTLTSNVLALGKRKETMDKVIGNLIDGRSIHFVTAADWSMVHLLMYLLEFSGPARVYISSFQIQEFAARIFSQLIDAGLIKELHCLVDYRLENRTPAIFHLIKNKAARIKGVPLHAKVTVIMNDEWGISVVGSANYTENKRIESGVICCDQQVAGFHKQWIVDELSDAKPFE